MGRSGLFFPKGVGQRKKIWTFLPQIREKLIISSLKVSIFLPLAAALNFVEVDGCITCILFYLSLSFIWNMFFRDLKACFDFKEER